MSQTVESGAYARVVDTGGASSGLVSDRVIPPVMDEPALAVPPGPARVQDGCADQYASMMMVLKCALNPAVSALT
jgi:hypothetical protein